MPASLNSYGQDWLIKRMQQLGYLSDPLGVCFGLALKANEAFLAGEFAHFYKRLRLIFDLPLEEICKRIENAKVEAKSVIKKVKNAAILRYHNLSETEKKKINAKFENDIEIQKKIKIAIINIIKKNLTAEEKIAKINHYKNEFLLNAYLQKKIDKALLSLSENVRLLLEIPVFLDGLEIYHQPQKHPHLFPRENLPFSQNREISESLILSKKLQELGGSITSPCFSGLYDLPNLTHYFDILREEIESIEPYFPFTIVLVSVNHIIIVSYDRETREWLLFEPNDAITSNNDEVGNKNINIAYIKKIPFSQDLAKNVLESFSDNKITALSTHLCTTKKFNIQLLELYQSWVDRAEMKELHTVTTEKASLCDSDNGTWLRSAIESNEINQVRLLLETGISANARNKDQSTPLYLSIDIDKINIVKELLKHGADPNLPYNDYFPLHKAAWIGDFDILELLLINKADINAVDQYNNTALYYAASYGHIKIVNRLLELGANLHITNKTGKTCQQIAADTGHIHIVETIQKHIEQSIPSHTVCKKIVNSINEFLNKEKINYNELQAWKVVKQTLTLPSNQTKTILKIINELKYKERKTNIDSIYPSYQSHIFSSENKSSRMLKKLIRQYKDKNLNEIDQKITFKKKIIQLSMNF